MASDLRTAVRIDVEGAGRFRGEMRRMGRSLDALGGSTRVYPRVCGGTDGRGRKVYRRQFVTAFQEAGARRSTIAVVQEGKDDSLAWTFVPARDSYANSRRRGFLLYRRGEK